MGSPIMSQQHNTGLSPGYLTPRSPWLPFLRLTTASLLQSLPSYPLPCRVGACFGNWGGCSSVQVMPRRDRSRSKRPSPRLWLPSHGEGSGRIIGLPGVADMAALSRPANLPGFTKLFSGSEAKLPDKRRRLVNHCCVQTASPPWYTGFKRDIEPFFSRPPSPSLSVWPARSATESRAVCTDPVAPANHCRIISTLREPPKTLLIGLQTFQGCGISD